MGVQIMSGSLPILSLVVPEADVLAVPGNVTGTFTGQLLPVVVSVTPVMVRPLAEYVYDSFGVHPLKWEMNG